MRSTTPFLARTTLWRTASAWRRHCEFRFFSRALFSTSTMKPLACTDLTRVKPYMLQDEHPHANHHLCLVLTPYHFFIMLNFMPQVRGQSPLTELSKALRIWNACGHPKRQCKEIFFLVTVHHRQTAQFLYVFAMHWYETEGINPIVHLKQLEQRVNILHNSM